MSTKNVRSWLLPVSILSLLAIAMSFSLPGSRQPAEPPRSRHSPAATNDILPAAARLEQYIPLLKGKSVGVFANQTSVIGKSHLVDTLLANHIKVAKIFSPEHGFRGTADAGEKVGNSVDSKTGIPLISLYGSTKKPTALDLKGLDVLLFDIQDVGTRFYTIIGSLQYFLESAIENDKELIILDRPNPNGFYVDGPVLEKPFTSFIGMQCIPVVHGMTVGEYARFLAGEHLLDSTTNQYLLEKKSAIKLTVIPCANYTHKSLYELPVKPSPNLPNIQSVYWYPSTCFFEGTILSEGRGTDKPFQIFGHPSLPKTLISFTPTSREGATTAKLLNQQCYGWDVSGTVDDVLKNSGGRLQLKWLINAYKLFPDKNKFFLPTNMFNKLAGNSTLMQQIKDGVSESDIRKSWQPGLDNFKKIRKKYLLYPDFE